MSTNYNFSTGELIQDFSKNIVKYSGSLTSGVAQSLTVPYFGAVGGLQSKIVVVVNVMRSPSADVWVSNNNTAVGGSGAFATTNSILVPASGTMIKIVNTGDVLSFISSVTGIQIGVEFYQAL